MNFEKSIFASGLKRNHIYVLKDSQKDILINNFVEYLKSLVGEFNVKLNMINVNKVENEIFMKKKNSIFIYVCYMPTLKTYDLCNLQKMREINSYLRNTIIIVLRKIKKPGLMPLPSRMDFGVKYTTEITEMFEFVLNKEFEVSKIVNDENERKLIKLLKKYGFICAKKKYHSSIKFMLNNQKQILGSIFVSLLKRNHIYMLKDSQTNLYINIFHNYFESLVGGLNVKLNMINVNNLNVEIEKFKENKNAIFVYICYLPTYRCIDIKYLHKMREIHSDIKNLIIIVVRKIKKPGLIRLPTILELGFFNYNTNIAILEFVTNGKEVLKDVNNENERKMLELLRINKITEIEKIKIMSIKFMLDNLKKQMLGKAKIFIKFDVEINLMY